MPSPEIEQILRHAQLRVTRPRIAVLNAVHEHPHADTNSIIDQVRRQLGEVSHQAVYDVLQALTGAGLVRRIQPSGSAARYEARVADNHHHIVCRSCGAVADVDCSVGFAPCLTPSETHGYAIDEAEVIYWGLCRSCTDIAANVSATPVGVTAAPADPAVFRPASAQSTPTEKTEPDRKDLCV